MKHFEFGWKTDDGLPLYAQGWQPDDELKAVVCLVHGLGEHSGRYKHVAEAFTAAGYALLAFDLRGHGKSAGQRGHAPSWDALLDDIAHLLSEAAQRFPNRPLFLYGHSMGGALVLNYALRRKPEITGVIASGPLLRTAFAPPAWKVALGRITCQLWPTMSMSNELDPNQISCDPAVVQAYVNDPLVHDRLSSRLGMDLLDGGQWALEHAAEFPLPLLLMHGGADGICSAAASAEFARRAGDKCTFKEWDGLYHEVHNDPQKAEVLQFIIQWMDARSER